MRIIVSIQSKRGSSRGIVHYIAHSKVDTLREPQNGRELFNEYADTLSVESANNSLKVELSRKRVSNDNLHHLVISFREKDYLNLGKGERERKAALKDVTRATMDSLKSSLKAERLFWVAAVHLNTDNPHVHIALQKQYFSQEIERCYLSKLSRDLLPHYERINEEKVLVPGLLIETAEMQMESIVAKEQANKRELKPDQIRRVGILVSSTETTNVERDKTLKDFAERSILGRAILGEILVARSDRRIDQLIKNDDRLRFVVSHPISGERHRLSLRDLDQLKNEKIGVSDPGLSRTIVELSEHPKQIIKTILLKMLAKQESEKLAIQNEYGVSIQEAAEIRTLCRKDKRKLPTPVLTKDQLDELQSESLEASDIRRFAYLERVRNELERTGEIEPRNEHDHSRIAAMQTIAELRAKHTERMLREFDTWRFYKRVDVDGKSISIADRDRASKDGKNIAVKIIEKIQSVANNFSHMVDQKQTVEQLDLLRPINQKLSEERDHLAKDLSLEQKKSNLLKTILQPNASPTLDSGSHVTHELAEIENLATTLKLPDIYKTNWLEQRATIESAGANCNASRRLTKIGKESELNEHQRKIIGGRAIAKEIIAKVNQDRAKEELDTFRKTKQFHKFPVSDLRRENLSYFSLNDVDLSSRKSLLDQVVGVLIEDKEHRRIRKTVTAMVKERGQRLKSEYLASKEILAAASEHASDFKKHSFLSHSGQPVFLPLLTRQEISNIEFRADHTKNPKEAAMLRSVLDGCDSKETRSLTAILGDFANRDGSRQGTKERDDSKPERTEVQTVSDQPVHQTFQRETSSNDKAASGSQVKELPISIQH